MREPAPVVIKQLRLSPVRRLVPVLPMATLLTLQAIAVQAASLDRPIAFSIPAQPLDGALLEFSRQADVQLAVDAREVDNIQAPELKGTLTAGVALRRLLSSSGFKYYTVGNTVTVRRIAGSSDDGLSPAETNSLRGSAPEAPQSTTSTNTPSGQSSRGSSYRSESDSRPALASVAEVLVTAQKRSERLQDVPVPVSVITSDSLLESNKLRLEDYYSSVPGVSLTSGGDGDTYLSIRGITTGAGANPTVGVVVDDVPFGPSTAAAGGASASVVPDIDPNDLARIEVLRGPQGTLYGASSIGGLLKFVTVDPSTSGFSGRVQADVGNVHNSGGVGYGVRASVNIPISETAALRASGFTRRDTAYIDDPLLQREGVNEINVRGGRVSGLWRPVENWSVKLGAIFQRTTGDGSSAVNLEEGLGDLQQSAAFPGANRYQRDLTLYTATVSGDFAGLNFTSISGYNVNKIEQKLDISGYYGGLMNLVFGDPATAAGGITHYPTKKSTQEFRLSNATGQQLEWLVGLFYNHENSKADYFNAYGVDPATGVYVGQGYADAFPTTFEEYAAFGDVTWHFTDRLDLQVGARESQNKQTYSESYTGPAIEPLFGYAPVINPEVGTKDSSFTYLVTPRFRISGDLMVYARLASGYRPGGPNPTAAVFNLPPSYKPDRTRSYEVGVKGSALEKILTFDASLYYIDWKDIQLQVGDRTTGAAFFTNASHAKSQGIELSLQANPGGGLKLATWVSWNDSELKSDLPVDSIAVGVAGDRLPYSSRFSGHFSADEDVVLPAELVGFVGGSLSYIGFREADFTQMGQRPSLPAYTQVDAHAGVRRDSWTINLFVNNATDRRGMISYQTLPAVTVDYIRPRTVGLSLAKTF
jgi:iron complex outermembrane recepter protein